MDLYIININNRAIRIRASSASDAWFAMYPNVNSHTVIYIDGTHSKVILNSNNESVAMIIKYPASRG